MPFAYGLTLNLLGHSSPRREKTIYTPGSRAEVTLVS
jgi:hypothetical protein